jgi:hypothetical protein
MRLQVATAFLVLLLQGIASPATAAVVGTSQDGTEVGTHVGEAPVDGGPPVGVSCPWEWYQLNDVTGMAGSGFRVDGLLTERLGRAVCDGVPGVWQWITIADDGFAISAMYAQARRTVPKPMPSFFPSLQPWHIAGYPSELWFTPEQLGMPSLSAVLPSGSAVTMAPVVRKVSFDPGNGDAPFACGKPKPVVQGDCSYLYPTSSIDAPNLTFPARVLITWGFPWFTTDGRSGTLPPATFATDVGMKVARVEVIAA